MFSCLVLLDSNATCNNGDVRLFGGATNYEGTIELCLGGVWGSICHFGWDINDANVICSQLDFSEAGNMPVYAAFFGQSSGPILISEVNCDGTESSLTECLVDVSITGCTHFQDAAVRCVPKCEGTSFILFMHVSTCLLLSVDIPCVLLQH